ncbi:MAG: ATP-binding protein [Vulcanimicrobiota bacterium]
MNESHSTPEKDVEGQQISSDAGCVSPCGSGAGSASPCGSGDGDAAAILSERTKDLEKALKELDAFTYSVSHELRAPLRNIAGYSQLLITKYSPSLPEDGQRYLQMIQTLTIQMDEMVDALLELSRLGSRELSPHKVNPGDLVRQALEGLKTDMEGRNLQIDTAELPPCRAVPSLLRQVYINLISNALKFTRKRDRAVIEIGGLREDNRNVYFVRDNGVGIPEASKDKLFILFSRLHRNEGYEGNGVGLALSKRIMERMEGTIWAESSGDNGTTFYFTLPDVPQK